MKVRKYQGSDQNEVLTGLIVSSEVLGKVYHKLGKEAQPFRSKGANLICEWCLEYYSKYRKAPQSLIRRIFEKWAEKHEDADGVDLIEQLLEHLDNKYKALSKEINSQWCIDVAAKHFEIVVAEKRAELLAEAAEHDDIERVRKIEKRFHPIQFGAEAFNNVFDSADTDETIEHFEQPDRALLHFRGALGDFINDAFTREAFVSFVGTEKKGKSYWLQESAWLGLRQGRRVLKYVIGDMSRIQYNERMYRRACLRPRTTRKVRLPKRIRPVPPKEKGENPNFDVKDFEREIEGISRSSVRRAKKKLQALTASKEIPLKIRFAGAGVISATDIENDIRELTSQGWAPDIVIVDYADLLRPEDGKKEFRHQINDTWAILRRISLDYHCLVITATQAAATNYSGWLMKRGDFSEDKRKNAHVTGMLGINQTPDEKRAGVYRLNWLFLRDGVWSDNQYVWTVGNLAIACPCLKSCTQRDNKKYESTKRKH